MLKKRVLAIGLAMVALVGSSFAVHAEETHKHIVEREVYIYSYNVPKSHTYEKAVLADGTIIYDVCNYTERVHILQVYCNYCDYTLGEKVEGGRAQLEHDCPPDQRP